MLDAVSLFLKQSFSERSNRKRFRRMNLAISVLVFVNVILLMISTLNDLSVNMARTLYVANSLITIVFAIEYFVRFKYTTLKRSKYFFRFTSIVDVISIYPALISIFLGINLSHMTFLRLLRVFKFFRTTKSVKLLQQVLKRTYRQLSFSFSLIGIMILIFSAMLYYAEGRAQPQHFSNIFDCIWWVISALTTSGYIDVYPITILGKIISSLIVIIGISLFAIPAGIITAGFIEEYKTARSKNFNKASETEQKKKAKTKS